MEPMKDSSQNQRAALALAAMLKAARERAGLLQADVAKRLGRSQGFVSKYELGQRGLGLAEAVEIASALKLPLMDFLEKWIEEAGL